METFWNIVVVEFSYLSRESIFGAKSPIEVSEVPYNHSHTRRTSLWGKPPWTFFWQGDCTLLPVRRCNYGGSLPGDARSAKESSKPLPQIVVRVQPPLEGSITWRYRSRRYTAIVSNLFNGECHD